MRQGHQPGDSTASEPEAFGQLRYLTSPEAVYPTEVIEAHRAFIARRRATCPSEDYRTPRIFSRRTP
jgi:hypothetical protein